MKLPLLLILTVTPLLFGASVSTPSPRDRALKEVPHPPLGALGYARYTLKDSDMKNLQVGSQLLKMHDDTMEFLAPVHDLQQLDLLGTLSHNATQLCGSMDYYPLNFTRADTMRHAPPHFAPRAQFAELSTLITAVDLPKMDATIATLAALPNRFHRSSGGQNAGASVNQIWQNELKTSGEWIIEQKTHTGTPQKSVIARLEGATPDTIVLGAHLDSIGNRNNIEALAPGADDDASGIAILTEILRIIETKGLRFHRSIELHGYAAEEIGLVGSREIATEYKRDEQAIDAMMQFDMAYYSRGTDGGRIFFLEDFTALDLTRNGIQWTKSYLGDVYQRGYLPRGSSSDHKSWWEQGYATLFPFENPEADNPYIHTADDTKDRFDDGTRIKRMVQLGLIFLAYEAGLTSLDTSYALEQSRLQAESVSKDLHLALTGTAEHYNFAVSAPSATAFLELCPIESETDFRCKDQRLRLTVSEDVKGRKVFYTTDAPLFKADEKWRVEAYDKSDVLLARRQIQWQN